MEFKVVKLFKTKLSTSAETNKYSQTFVIDIKEKNPCRLVHAKNFTSKIMS